MLVVVETERPMAQPQFPGDHVSSIDFRSSNPGHSSVSHPNALPPSPPVRPEPDFDGSSQSPSAASSQSSTAIPTYFGAAMGHLEPHQQRHLHSASMAGNPMLSQVASPSYHPSGYPPSPGTISNYSYHSPVHMSTGVASMYYQRTLPSTFPPPSMPGAVAQGLPFSHDGSPIHHGHQWQHHHYISPSSSAAFASQSQDRYVCQTCNKAFSRPSSLRIHSHSHTGEKPFKCPHAGCGKAFSVRSNMKRHERGCHGGGSPDSS